MIQDSINQMLGTAGLVGGYSRKNIQDSDRIKMQGKKNIAINTFEGMTKELGSSEKDIEKIKAAGKKATDFYLKGTEEEGSIFSPSRKERNAIGADINDAVNAKYIEALSKSMTGNSEPMRKKAMQTAAQEAVTPQQQSATLASLINDLKGLTGVSDKIANNSTKKDLTKIINKYEGGK